MPRAIRPWVRASLLSVLAGTTAIVLAVLISVLMITQTTAGRAWARGRLLQWVDGQLSGTLRLDGLAFQPWHRIVVTGLSISDPSGERVLGLQTLVVHLGPWRPWLRGAIEVTRVVADGLTVDLGDGSAGTGLMAALAPSNADGEVTQDEGAGQKEPWLKRLAVPNIQLRGASVKFASSGLGPAVLTGLSAQLGVVLDEHVAIDVARVHADFAARAVPPVVITRLAGRWSSAPGARASLGLTCGIGPATIDLSAVAPDGLQPVDSQAVTGGPRATKQASALPPVELKLRATQLTGASMAQWLHVAELSEILDPMQLQATVTGEAGRWAGEVQLHGQAGGAHLELHGGRDSLVANLTLKNMQLDRWVAMDRAHQLAARIDARITAAEGSMLPLQWQGAEVGVQLLDGSVDGEPLPTFQVHGLPYSDRISDLCVQAAGYGASLAMQGHYHRADGWKAQLNLQAPTLRRLPHWLIHRAGQPIARSADGHVRLAAMAELANGQLAADVHLDVEGLSLMDASIRALSLDLRGAGKVSAPTLTGTISGHGLRWGDLPVARLWARIKSKGRRGQLKLRLNATPIGSLGLSGNWRLPGPSLPTDRILSGLRSDVRLEASAIDLSWLADRVGALRGQRQDHDGDRRGRTPEPTGRLDGVLDARLTGGDLSLAGRIDSRVRLNKSAPALSLHSTAQLAGRRLGWQAQVRDGRGPWLRASGGFQAPEDSTGTLATIGSVGAPGGALAGLRLPVLSMLLGEAPLARGQWQAKAKLRSRALGASPLALPGAAPFLQHVRYGLELSAVHDAHAEPKVHLAGHLQMPTAALDLAHDLKAPCSSLVRARSASAGFELVLENGALTTTAELGVTGRPLAVAQGGLSLSLARWLRGGGAVEVGDDRLDVTLMPVPAEQLPVVCRHLRGALVGRVQLGGWLENQPRLNASVKGDALQLFGQPFANLTADMSMTPQRLQLKLAAAHGTDSSRLSVDAPLQTSGRRVVLDWHRPAEVDLVLNRFPLAALLAPTGRFSRVTGVVSGQLSQHGPLSKPEVMGTLSPKNAALTITALAQPLHDIRGQLQFSGSDVVLHGLQARDGPGRLRLDGKVRARRGDAGSPHVVVDLAVLAEDLPLRAGGQVAGTLDTEATVSATITSQESQVHVSLGDTAAFLSSAERRVGMDLEPHPDVFDPRAAAPLPRSRPGDLDPTRAVTVEIHTRRPVWVRRDDFAVRLEADIEARIRAGQAIVAGKIALDRGYLDLLGTPFEVDSGSEINFVRAAQIDPALSISASHHNRRTDTQVQVQIGGRASDPQLKFFVDGQTVSVGEAARAMLGGDADDGDRSAEDQAQSFVTGVVAGLMAMSARRELGDAMPILMVETEDGGRAGRVRAGFDLDKWVPAFLQRWLRGVYVEGVVAGDSRSNSGQVQSGVLIELHWPDNVVTSGRYGPGESWSLDLGWSP